MQVIEAERTIVEPEVRLQPEFSFSTGSELSVSSFFSGLGFLDLGFEKNNFHIASVNEIRESFLGSYIHSRKCLGIANNCDYFPFTIDHFLNNSKILPNVRDVKLSGFIGGPPCPDFSIAGKQNGRAGDNGRLTDSYSNVILKYKPSWFLFENVKGLWRTKKHRAFFDEICRRFIDEGYCISYELLNALEFGVPQDRERIFLFGVSKDLVKMRSGGVLSMGKFPWRKFANYDLATIKTMPWPKTVAYGGKPQKPEGCEQALMAETWFTKNKVINHPNSRHAFKPQAGLQKFLTVDEGDDSRKSYKRLHRWRYSPTAAYGNNEVHIHPYFPRRLSAAEALAIQSLPIDFELPSSMTLSDMFKGIGNGVPFLLADGLAKTIQDYLLNL